jgi:hypothetical protein
MNTDTIRILIALGAALIASAVLRLCGFDVVCFSEKGLVSILKEYLER